jgi:hypothetical protein
MSINFKELVNPILQGFCDSASDPDYQGPNIHADHKVSTGPEFSR